MEQRTGKDNNAPIKFASLDIETYRSHTDNNQILNIKMWKNSIFLEFLKFRGKGETPDKGSASLSLEVAGIFASVLNNIVADRVECFRKGKPYNTIGGIPMELCIIDRETGQPKTVGQLYIRTINVDDIPRVNLGFKAGDKDLSVTFVSSIAPKFIDTTAPGIKANVDLFDAPFNRFTLIINELIKQTIVYSTAQYLKQIMIGGSTGGGGSGGGDRKVETGGDGEDNIPF